MGPAPRRALLAALLCLAALAAGCSVGPSTRPPVAVRGVDMPAPPSSTAPRSGAPAPEPAPQNPSIEFAPCTRDAIEPLVDPPPDRTLQADCSEIVVPADPEQPGLGVRQLGVLRVGPADAPLDRPPLLVVGDSATEPSARHAVTLAAQVPLDVLQRYTLVGLDRRGAGTDLLDCARPSARAALVDADPGTATDAGLAALLESARAVVQECYLAQPGGISGYRTTSTAADVEQVRAQLGVPRLSAIGVGDGAAALAAWARTSPSAVGRLVLDGPPDPALDEPERAEARAKAAEAAFDTFAVACAARPDCPLGPSPRAAVAALVERLRGQPLAADDGRRLTAGAAVTALLTALGEPRDWPELAAALAAARAGDPAGLLGVVAPVAGPDGRFESMVATRCNDAKRRLTPGEVGQLAATWRGSYPVFGGTMALGLLACAPWPAITSVAPFGPANEAPPILVIGTARDPRSPLEGSRRAADGLATAQFLSWQGSGTGAYPRTPCVTAAVGELLVSGTAPRGGTLCPP